MLAIRSRVALFFAGLVLLVPSAAYAALVNINTASEGALEGLPGIGPSKASAIIQYRTDHGPFAATADIEQVSGIGPATYANIAALITVGGASVQAATSAPVVESVSSDTHVPPKVAVGDDVQAYAEVPHSFSASASAGATLVWNFGDGSTETGNPVTKTYRYPGTYRVEVMAQAGLAVAEEAFTVTVVPALVRVASVTGLGVTLTNENDTELDLSAWSLVAGVSRFRFPEGSVLLPHTSVLFPQAITDLPVDFDTQLLYPDGVIAVEYVPVQPRSGAESSTSMKANSAVISQSRPTHEEQIVSAPRGQASVPSPRGAAVATDTPFANALSADVAASTQGSSPLAGLARSSWAIGLLGVLTVAGGALLVL